MVRVKVCAEWLLRCATTASAALQRLMPWLCYLHSVVRTALRAFLRSMDRDLVLSFCAPRYTREPTTKIRILWSLKNGYDHDTYTDIVGWIARQMDPQEYAMLHKQQPFLGLQRQQGHAPQTQNEEWLHESAPAVSSEQTRRPPAQ